jgi:hypothetical protein
MTQLAADSEHEEEAHQLKLAISSMQREKDKENKMRVLKIIKVLKSIVQKQIGVLRDKRHNTQKEGCIISETNTPSS